MFSFIEYRRRSRKTWRSRGVGFSTSSALVCGPAEVRVAGALVLAISVLPGVVPFADEPLDAGSPPPVVAVAGLAPAPTWRPGGAPATEPPDPEPPASPFFPVPRPSVSALSARTSGVPSAPGFPSGDAAKLPRRLPAGGSAGGVTEGWRLRAMI